MDITCFPASCPHHPLPSRRSRRDGLLLCLLLLDRSLGLNLLRQLVGLRVGLGVALGGGGGGGAPQCGRVESLGLLVLRLEVLGL
jgi:hypothetical protein